MLEPWTTTPVQHIGSTAIPGMPAKPVLDLMVGVADLADAGRAAELLADHGWQRRTHRVDAELAVLVRDGLDAVHLHLTTTASDLWRERLGFRDALRADPALVAEYAELKRRLLAANDGAMYAGRDKEQFVRRVLAGIGVGLRDDRHA